MSLRPVEAITQSADLLLGDSPFENAESPLSLLSGKMPDGDTTSSGSSSDSSPSSSPRPEVAFGVRGRKRTKTPDQKEVRLPIRKGGLQLWQFLYTLLEDPAQFSELIEWTERRSELEFRMLEPEALAAWWGYIKHRPNMSYERLSRSLRFYYDKGILKKMGGERFLYRFRVSPELMYDNIGNSDNRPTLKSIPPMVRQHMSKYTKQNYYYPHCYQFGSYSGEPPRVETHFVPHSSPSCYNYEYSSTTENWRLPTAGTRPRLYSLDQTRSSPSLPTYEDHLARCNSLPLSLSSLKTTQPQPTTQERCFSAEELSLIRAAAETQRHYSTTSSSELASGQCSPQSAGGEFNVDIVMQEILQLTTAIEDQYTLPQSEFSGCGGPYPESSQYFFPSTTDDASIVTITNAATSIAAQNTSLLCSLHSPQSASEWTDTTIY